MFQALSSVVLNGAMAGKDQQRNKQADHGLPRSCETRGKAQEEKEEQNVGTEGGNRQSAFNEQLLYDLLPTKVWIHIISPIYKGNRLKLNNFPQSYTTDTRMKKNAMIHDLTDPSVSFQTSTHISPGIN